MLLARAAARVGLPPARGRVRTLTVCQAGFLPNHKRRNPVPPADSAAALGAAPLSSGPAVSARVGPGAEQQHMTVLDVPSLTSGSKRTGHWLEDALVVDEAEQDYAQASIADITRSRTGWLVAFGIGLLLTALVVEQFEEVLEHHVALSYFVPLIIGHGGNTGSQAVTTVIRALALKQVTHRDAARVVLKEAGAGCLMGAVLGLAILGFSTCYSGIGGQVGAAVAVALPLVSLWANGLGAFLTLMADRFKFDPAVTSVPLMTTIIDSTGLVLYFVVAQYMLSYSVEVM